ncbi:MAG: dihydrodipicolinate synthase family protein, partial [Alphaproteobacteria bacterium]|nr:dihydrodipicolinate synthase family protein [Alphaproteobacteria bacterium]
RMVIGPEFCQMSGEDATVVPFLAGGGQGCISVTANIAPRMCADLHKAWRERDLDTVMELQDTLMPVHLAMFCETSPAPVKYAATLLGKCLPEVRLPMCEITDASKAQVKAALTGAGLLA